MKYEFISGETIQLFYVQTYVGVNNAIQAVQELISLKNPQKTVKAIFILAILSWFTSILSDYSMLWLSKYH